MGKAQAAFEFLTTYGWAFMVILVMIGAISYFGLTKPPLPGRCLFSPEIACLEFKIESGTSALFFKFRNEVGTTADFNFTATFIGYDTPNVACADFANVSAGRTNEVKCTYAPGLFSQGDYAKFEIMAFYRKDGAQYWNPVKGEVFGTIQ
jgi:hypothetical protein